MANLEDELKQLIIETFELDGMVPADIDSEAPLFGNGLGLDSIDALELGVALKKNYHIYIDTNSAELLDNFFSVKTLARFIESQNKSSPS